MDNSFDEPATSEQAGTQEPESPSTMQAALDIRKLDALATETWLLIILAIMFGGLCIFKFWGLSWLIFVPTAIIMVVAMVKLWDVKTANELKNRAARGDTQAQHRLDQRKQQRQQLKEKVIQISNQTVAKVRTMMSPDNLRRSDKNVSGASSPFVPPIDKQTSPQKNQVTESANSDDDWRLE